MDIATIIEDEGYTPDEAIAINYFMSRLETREEHNIAQHQEVCGRVGHRYKTYEWTYECRNCGHTIDRK